MRFEIVFACLYISATAVFVTIAGCSGGSSPTETPGSPAISSSSSSSSSSSVERLAIVSWTQVVAADGLDAPTGFRIYRSMDNNRFDLLETLPADITSWTDNAVGVFPVYYYYVTAFNEIGESEPSEIVRKEFP